MNLTPEQKIWLAKQLPEMLGLDGNNDLWWTTSHGVFLSSVKVSEELHLVSLVEAKLTPDRARTYHDALGRIGAGGAWLWHANQSQRITALMEVFSK